MENTVLHHQLQSVQKDIGSIKEALSGVTESLQSLVKLEVAQTNTKEALERAFSGVGKVDERVDDLDKRIQALEMLAPGMKELRRWIIGGIGIGISMLFVSLLNLVLTNTKNQDFVYQMLLQRSAAQTQSQNPQMLPKLP